MKFVFVLTILSCSSAWMVKKNLFTRQMCDLQNVTRNIVLESNKQLVIFMDNNLSNAPELNSVIQKFSQAKPSIVGDWQTENKISKKYYTRQVATLVIIFHRHQKTERLYNIITRLAASIDLEIRPKCLVLYFHEYEDTSNFENITQFAWTEKFLDFTMLGIILTPACPITTIHYFDPFRDTYYKMDFGKNVSLFPDKIVDVNGFQLKIGGHRKLTTDRQRNLRSGFDNDRPIVALLSAALKKLNFSYNLFYSGKISRRSMRLNNGQVHIDLHPIAINGSTTSYPRLRCQYDCERLNAVVPMRTRLKLQFPISLAILGLLILITGITFILKYLLNLNSHFWNTLNVIELLIGMPVHVRRLSGIQKIFFVTFSFISLIYYSQFFSDILHIKYKYEIVTFETFEDIDKSELLPYINDQWHSYAFDHQTNTHVIKIKKNSELVKDINSCFKYLQRGKPVACICPNGVSKQYFDPTTMQIAKPAFNCLYRAYWMEKGSPFINKLQLLMHKIQEAGLVKYFAKPTHNGDDTLRNIIQSRTVDTVIILSFVLIVGYSFSFVAFIYEILRKRF